MQAWNPATVSTLRMCWDPGFGPLDENEAANGAGVFTSWLLYITADGDLKLNKIFM